MEGFESLLILMVVVWGMGKIFRIISLPVIFGELLGGIIVGPMILGIVDPADPTIKVLADLGIFFLMLHAGLETDPKELLKGSKKSLFIAIGGLLLPFVSIFIATKIFHLDTMQAVFIGLALSATSIAMSYRILKDYKIQNTDLGHSILSAAIISDIAILITFSILLEVLNKGSVSVMELSFMLLKVILFFVIVLIGGFKVQKYMNQFFSNKGFTFTLIVALCLGLIAEAIGLHVIIGAFLAGLFIREEIIDEKVFEKIEDRIYGLSYSFLGPIFFTSLAFNLSFEGLWNSFGIFIALFLIAFLAKFFGSGLGAFFQKVSLEKSVLTGLIMNGRGALDLIIISIGLKQGLIDKTMFSILVLIAFSATLLTILIIRPLKWTKKITSSS